MPLAWKTSALHRLGWVANGYSVGANSVWLEAPKPLRFLSSSTLQLEWADGAFPRG